MVQWLSLYFYIGNDVSEHEDNFHTDIKSHNSIIVILGLLFST
jgi:hypothetical protein